MGAKASSTADTSRSSSSGGSSLVYMLVSTDRRTIAIDESVDPAEQVDQTELAQYDMTYNWRYTKMATQGRLAKIAAQNAVMQKHGFCRVANSKDCFYNDEYILLDDNTLDDIYSTIREAVDESNKLLSRDCDVA